MNPLLLSRRTAPPLAGFAAGWLVCLALTSATAPVVPPVARVTPSQLSAGSPPGGRGGGAETPLPVRLARLTEDGYTAAGKDLTAALTRAREARGPGEGDALIRGIFVWVAGNFPPGEAIRLAGEQGDYYRNTALGTLAGQWSGRGAPLQLSGEGAAREAARLLFSSEATPRDAADAWLAAFSHDPDRVGIATEYATAHLAATPEKLLPLAEDFTPWERERFLADALLRGTAQGKDPAETFSWIRENWEQVPGEARTVVFWHWAQTSPEKLMEEVAATGDASRREELIPAAATALAVYHTEKALAWTDSLPDEEEREAARAAIREATPAGIGAGFSLLSGLPELNAVYHNGPAAEAGFLAGDRLVSVTGPDGETFSFHNAGREEVRSLLRGEAGDTLHIRLLRRDAATGVTSELTLPVTRRQLTR